MQKQITYLKSVYKLKDLPQSSYPEIILCGRSNVGKSSFINSLFNRKTLAKTSSTPGKTRSLNYYMVDQLFYLVDLPGFGYARVSKEERDYWDKLIREYFAAGRPIRAAFHLIDSRHKPTPLDIQLNKYLRINNLETIFILSKADKLSNSQLAVSKRQVKEIFPEAGSDNRLIAYSAVEHTGRKEVLRILSHLFE